MIDRMRSATVTSLPFVFAVVSVTASLAHADTHTNGEPGLGAAEQPLTEIVSETQSRDRTRFLAARQALRAGNRSEALALADSLDDYPLQHYLRYEQLLDRWKRITPRASAIRELNAFEVSSGDAGLTRRLTHTLQKRLATTGQWSRFLGLKKSRYARGMPCTTLRARFEAGAVRGFDKAALELWMQPSRSSRTCRGVLETLEARHTPPLSAIWERIYRAIEANEPRLVRDTYRHLSKADRREVERWLKARSNPRPLLTGGRLKRDTPLNRRIVSDLIVRWSRQDTQAAMKHWLEIRDDYTFFADRYYDTHRAVAMRAAYRRMPEAYFWLNAFEADADDLELLEWRVRTALLAGNWGNVLSSLSGLPRQERLEDHWAYWEARALAATGLPSEAERIYRRIADLQSWHGFLASDQLGLPYNIKDEPVEPEAEMLSRLQQRPEYVRAREYHAVELAWEGRREWNDALEGLNPDELAVSAWLADQWGLYDRAIFSAGKAERQRALSLRFPILHRAAVDEAAARNRIDPAWIFGVMRRESAYMADIKSSAGAIGLMQLMPGTADYVAKLRGDVASRRNLTDPESNIGFGSYYLRHVMDQFDDHMVLATASYNAGPHRSEKWLPPKVMDADIWIDTIPFTETRRYVRAVLAYTTIYEWRLTLNPVRLSEKLTPIPAATGT